MRRKVEVLIWVVVVSFLLSGTAGAEGDTVILKSGMTLKGRIISESEKGLRMDVNGLGKMVVPRDKIKTINGKEPAPVTESEPVAPVTPAEPEKKPEPVPDVAPTPDTRPDTRPEPTPETEPEPERPASRAEVRYEELRKGQTLLFVFRGKDHGEWVESGPRIIAEIALVGKRRFKIITDPEAGVLGEQWVKREQLLRAIRIDENPERRLMFFSEGVGSGSWVRGITEGGDPFEGQLGGVTAEGSITLWRADGDRVVKSEVQLLELKRLTAVTPSRTLQKRLGALAAGEPVTLEILGRDEPVSGRIVRIDREWISLSVGDPREGGTQEEHIYRGLPITGVKTLPETVRKGLLGLADDGWVTLEVQTEDEEGITRRSATGRLRYVSLSEISLVTADGEETFAVSNLQGVSRTATEQIPVLTARKEDSTAETVLPVRPGMTRAEVEKRLPVGLNGVDLLYEDDRIGTVFLRPPFPGPIFGIRFDDPLAKALTKTDLVFDVQITPKNADGESVVTMISKTLTHLEVRLLVSVTGEILAMEVSGR